MTPRQWNTYFKMLKPDYKAEILKPLQTLDTDPVFKEAFGNAFLELSFIIIQPLEFME